MNMFRLFIKMALVLVPFSLLAQDKANKVKDEAEKVMDKARGYFDELKTKGSEAFKEHFDNAEKTMSDLFGKKEEPKTT